MGRLPKTMKTGIGKRISDLREDHGLTLEEFASQFAGVTANTVSKWETGKVALNSDHIVKIANFFNVSTDWLLTGCGTQNIMFCNSTGLSDYVVQCLLDDEKRFAIYQEKLKNTCDPHLDPAPSYSQCINFLFENDMQSVLRSFMSYLKNHWKISDPEIQHITDVEDTVRLVIELIEKRKALNKDVPELSLFPEDVEKH